MAITTSTTQPEGLSQELNELLLELGLSLQRYALYPGGHPSVDAAVAALTRRLDLLLLEREALSLGVARRQLVVEGVATEASHPVLRSVAERLHRHRVGVVTFRRGVVPAELSAALRAVSEDPERTGDPLGLRPREAATEWPHVRFHPLTYEQLQLAAEETAEEERDQALQARGTAAAELWVGLARAALAKETWREEEHDADPAQVAAAINQHHGVQAYDQVIVGFLLQLADELRTDGGGSVHLVRRRVSQVIRRLDPATLDRLLEMGGDVSQRMRFLHHATQSLSPDAVLEVLGAAARAEGQDVSTSMLRLLRKLSITAEQHEGDVRERADTQLREQVHSLLIGWSLVDPNPGAYTRALESMSRDSGASDGPSDHVAEPLRLVQMGVEIGAGGVPFTRAVDALVAAGRVDDLHAVIDGATEPNPAVDSIWRRLETADHVRRVLTTDPIHFDSLDRVLHRLPQSTVISLLLDRISESESRATRMGVFLRLVRIGLPVAPAALERLRDPRWYVLRNMLALLHEIDAWPVTFSALPYAQHEHATVRREALPIAVRIPAERDDAICLALDDTDERAMRIGINAARETGLPDIAVPIVLRRLADAGLSSDVITSLLRLLSRHGTPEVAAALVDYVQHGRTLLGRPRLAPRSPEMLAALASLAAIAPDDARSRSALELARASADPVVRQAARVKAE